MVRKLKFDVRKRSSQGETKLTASDVKALTQPTSTMVNAETQTDSQWFVDSKEVQTESGKIAPMPLLQLVHRLSQMLSCKHPRTI